MATYKSKYTGKQVDAAVANTDSLNYENGVLTINAELKVSSMGTSDNSVATKKYVDEHGGGGSGDLTQVPKHQATTTVIQNALTNLNGRELTSFEANLTNPSDTNPYTYYTITKSGSKLSTTQAEDYMEYMTGSRFVPTYNYEKPQNSLFVMADGTMWKPQYLESTGLLLYKLPGTSSSASNIQNGTSTGDLVQKVDVASWTFSNPNSARSGTTITTGTGDGTYATSMGGKSRAEGKRSVAQGTQTIAQGSYSHAEGNNTLALGTNSHAEGLQTVSSGTSSHAEGYQTIAGAESAHSEGYQTRANAYGSHAEGGSSVISTTIQSAGGSGAPSSGTTSSESPNDHLGNYAHAEGDSTYVHGYAAHAEGVLTKACAHNSHAEGYKTIVGSIHTVNVGTSAHAEGQETSAFGTASHAEGVKTIAQGDGSHASGYGTKAVNIGETVVGLYNIEDTTGKALFTVGNGTSTDSPSNAFVVYNDNTAKLGTNLIATQNYVATAINNGGFSTLKYLKNGNPQGSLQIEAGSNCTASNQYATALGYHNTASGYGSFAIGGGTTASSYWAFSGGEGSQATANHAFAYGLVAKAGHTEQFAIGKYNVNKDNTLFEVGNGSASSPSNALEVYADGTVVIPAGAKGIKIGSTVLTEEKLNKLIALLDTM